MASASNRDTPAPNHQIDEIELRHLGEHFVELGEKLKAVGQLTENQSLPNTDGSTLYTDAANREMTEEEVQAWSAEVRGRVRKTLTGLRDFRRDYERWQRLTAEFALTRLNYTQRDTAELLGVAASTINRWAQHPLPTEDYS